MRRPRTTLAVRIGALAVAIVVVTGIIAGALATGLVRSSSAASAQNNLAHLADVVQDVSGPGNGLAQVRARKALAELSIRVGAVRADGTLITSVALVRDSVTPTDIQTLLSGGIVSASRQIDGTRVLVQGRPTATGGIVLVQRRADATTQVDKALRRFILALLIAGGVALVLGLVVAWRMSIPLRRTAGAAHALASGRRDIVVPVQGAREVAEVAAAVNTLTGALTHSESRQREFLLSVSHDLRTPLTAIRGYAESLADGVVDGSDVPRVGGVLLAEAQRLQRLVADLLDLARLDAQDVRLEFAPVDLADVVRAAAPVWADRCAAGGVEFRLELIAAEPLTVVTDAARLRQALDGLFDNALRVTPSGRPIVLAARAEGPATVAAEVRDGGPGLTDDDIGVAFRQGALYERYRGEREVGTGFGLAIVHRVVTRLGGAVEAGHAVEGGARFTIRLPR